MINIFEQIKQKCSLLSYVGKIVTLRKNGNKYLGLCPFHSEKTGSFYVDPVKDLFYCFGCSKGGDLFDFYTQMHSCDKHQALKDLAQLYQIPLSEKKLQHNPLNNLADYFHDLLIKDNKALHYLESRKIDLSLIKKHKIGLCLKALNFLRKNNYTTEVNDYFWSMLDSRIVFPIFDNNFNVLSFGGRIYLPNDERAKYINGPATVSFDKSKILYQNFLHKDYIYITEGYLDVVALSSLNLNAAASMGTSFTSYHLINLIPYYKKIFIAFDSDEAGQRSSLKFANMILEFLDINLEVYFVKIPESEDPASYIEANKNFDLPSDTLDIFLFNSYIKKTDNINEKIKILEALTALSLKIKNKMLGFEYKKRWKNLWWDFYNNYNKKNQNFNITYPKYEKDYNVLLLFKYIVLYPEIKDDVLELFVMINLSNDLNQELNLLLNDEKLSNHFLEKLDTIKLMNSFKDKNEILKNWFDIFETIQKNVKYL